MEKHTTHASIIRKDEKRDNCRDLFYTHSVKRIVLALILLMVMSSLLFALPPSGDTSLTSLRFNALSSISYYGSFSDIFVNPASLPLLSKNNYYQVSLSPSESYNTSLWGVEPQFFMQNTTNELQGTVVSGPVSLSAKISNSLNNRVVRDDSSVYYDNYSGFDVELGFGYSFINHIAIGARLGGGNSVARLSKKIDNIFTFIGDSYFSPYEKLSGTERFNVNVGALLYNNNLSLGLVLGDLLGQKSDETFLEHFISNTTIGLSYKGDEYTLDGDLVLLVPRLGLDFKGIGFKADRSISISGDITLQFLKDILLDWGIKYSYQVSKDDVRTSVFSTSLYGVYEDFSISLNLAFLDNVSENFRPSIVFTYSK